jgi:hypothetical protein
VRVVGEGVRGVAEVAPSRSETSIITGPSYYDALADYAMLEDVRAKTRPSRTQHSKDCFMQCDSEFGL